MRKVKSKNQFNNEKEFLQNARNIGSMTTIDFETLENDTVTVRERDTGKQKRVSVPELTAYTKERL